MTNETHELFSARLHLRPWRLSDAEALFSLAKDPAVGPIAGWPPHKSVEESTRVIKEVLQGPNSYAICERGRADALIGAIALKTGDSELWDVEVDDAELGYWIGRPHWRQGFASEAARLLVGDGFSRLGLARVWASCNATNIGSMCVQEGLGMRLVRIVPDYTVELTGEKCTEQVRIITAAEWNAAQPHLQGPLERRLQQLEGAAILDSVPKIAQIRSGGQTGADRGALDAARAAGVAICGWCPPDGAAEDYPQAPGLLADYPELKEGHATGYVERTAWNVRDAHATLIVAPLGLEPQSGTEMTKHFARAYGRPCMVVEGPEAAGDVCVWLDKLGAGLTLNVAGPRESKLPGIYRATYELVRCVLATYARR